LGESGRSTVWLASVIRKVSCVSACEMAKLVGPRAAALPSVPPLVRKVVARSTSLLDTATRSAYEARLLATGGERPVGEGAGSIMERVAPPVAPLSRRPPTQDIKR